MPSDADRPAAKAVQPADLDKGQRVRGIRSQRANRDIVIPEIGIGDVQEDTDVIPPGFTMNHESHESEAFSVSAKLLSMSASKPLIPSVPWVAISHP